MRSVMKPLALKTAFQVILDPVGNNPAPPLLVQMGSILFHDWLVRSNLFPPEVWKRDLCQFYSQIWSWRLTAEGCGLSLPALPTRDGSASAGEQWEQARDYWKMIFDIWRNETQDTGIFEQGR